MTDRDPISTVHIVFKTHLDIGFTALARDVKAGYFARYIPEALELARHFREAGGPERFIWTTGSWLIYEYLEQASPEQRRRLEQAIAGGDIAWHGLPFTTHSELIDPSLFAAGLRLAQELDRRFGRHTIAAKMTDVPGHTRGIVPPLAAAGIEFLHIGVNPASKAPDVPSLFVWRAPTGEEVMVGYQKGSYGDLLTAPGLSEALLFAHSNDNEGPQSVAGVVDAFRRAAERFPGATVMASTMDRFAAALGPIRQHLPVVTQEIGDTWIHGAGSDPTKVARYRELCRLRREWLAAASVPDPAIDDLAPFSRNLLLVAEHTWGLDVKSHLGNWTDYSAPAFRAARGRPEFRRMEESWAEQRAYVDEGVAALGDTPRGAEARARLEAIRPARPDHTGFTRIDDPARLFETNHLAVRLHPAHGALVHMQDTRTGRVWADGGHSLALFRYQTFSQEDYRRFWRQYVVNKREHAGWAWPDQTKPGMETAGPVHRWWLPRLERLWAREDSGGLRLLAELSMDQESWTAYGAPRLVTIEVVLPRDEPAVQLTVQWFDKLASRPAEAAWLSFVPPITDTAGWSLDKMGRPVSPLEVVRNGNRRLHAVLSGATYTDAGGALRLETLDAPLIAPGEPSLLNFTNRQPPLRDGMHVNLYNNVWGTNFRMWFEEDARFRFTLGLS